MEKLITKYKKEKKSTEPLSFTVDPTIKTDLDKLSKKHGIPVAELLRIATKELLEKVNK